MCPDRVKLHVLFRDTLRELKRFESAARESSCLQEAADFARYVSQSVAPVLMLFPFESPLPCDGHLLRSIADALLAECQRRWREHDCKPKVDRSELEAINRKLDLLAGHVARISPLSASVILPPMTTGGRSARGRAKRAPGGPPPILDNTGTIETLRDEGQNPPQVVDSQPATETKE